MSASHRYHQPDGPDPADDDAESDLDLDLDELDPISSSNANGSHAKASPRERLQSASDTAARIPLRNLRRGLRNYGESRNKAYQKDEDAQGLLDGGEYGKRSAADDDGPILPLAHNIRRSSKEEGLLAKIGSRIRVPSFKTGRSPSSSHPQDDEAEPEEEHDPSSNRSIAVGQTQNSRFPANAVSNAKYTPWSFLPRTLYNEFSFFFNMYFLLVALSQIIPALRVGYLYTYIIPLACVLTITLGKEAADDISRRKRDAEANSEAYTVLRFTERGYWDDANGTSTKEPRKQKKSKKANKRSVGAKSTSGSERPTSSVEEITKASRDLKVGDVLKLNKNQRVPADLVILRSDSGEMSFAGDCAEAVEKQADNVSTLLSPDADGSPSNQFESEVEGYTPPGESDSSGEAFIRTDQLDGETDWKLRLASPLTQMLDVGEYTRLRVVAGKPDRKVNDFAGTVELLPKGRLNYDPHVSSTGGDDNDINAQVKQSSLTIDNTAWANTILASSSTVYAVVVYTGAQTRQALSTSASRSKTGLLEYEINNLVKILCVLTVTLSFVLVALEGFKSKNDRPWYLNVMRFLVLFSTIIPISLRVNLDMAKVVYAHYIQTDKGIPGTVVRTSTIPEDLGRIEYLLSDKTGTLTQNEMDMKKIHIGTVSYANEAMDEVASYVRQALPGRDTDPSLLMTPSSAYNVPATSATRTRREIGQRVRDVVLALALCHNVTPTMEEEDGKTITNYQASSPDEIAIVKWTGMVGLRLLQRDRHSMTLQASDSGRIVVRVDVLNVFPFTSDTKRMGIIVRFHTAAEGSTLGDTGEEIWFYQKGADTIMTSIVASNDWLDEETANMAREGLRTLVVGRKRLSSAQYVAFTSAYKQASLSLQSRDANMAAVVRQHLEHDLELLGITGVEDKLQRDVKPSLELLRNAGIKIWMLTGDKVETARCVAISSKLVSRGQYIHTIAKLKRKDLAIDQLDLLRSSPNSALLIDGDSLSLMLTHHRDAFVTVAVRLPAVIACRCSPTQKADVARLIRAHTKKRVCCIGDGGNDVSMIQAADVGVGIVGKEGRQASLAADFSVEQFCYLTKLLVWHGRNSYKRSAKLAQFIIHRGLIISVCQTLYSIASSFEPNALYRDWLLVGYATLYTSIPVFSLVLDRDVDPHLAHLYPELYKELTSGKSLSYKTFFVWVGISIYQGCVIQGLSQILTPTSDGEEHYFTRMVAVSYTVLILNEIVMVAVEITTWHWIMICSILGTIVIYFGSVPTLAGYFDLEFVISTGFLWRVAAILAAALIPIYAGKVVGRTLRPSSYRKVRGV